MCYFDQNAGEDGKWRRDCEFIGKVLPKGWVENEFHNEVTERMDSFYRHRGGAAQSNLPEGSTVTVQWQEDGWKTKKAVVTFGRADGYPFLTKNCPEWECCRTQICNCYYPPCENCHGTGEVTDYAFKVEDCPLCAGDGYTTVRRRRLASTDSHRVMRRLAFHEARGF